jgi:hydrogenase maturation protease
VTDAVRRIADAVLYEGYVLWPYRRSALKNQRRWTFGGVHPEAHGREHPDDRWRMRTECLVEGEPDVEVRVRFLQIVRRDVALPDGALVDELTVDGERHLAWDEAVEREVAPGPVAIAAGREVERLGGAGLVIRSWEALAGAVEVRATRLRPGLTRLTVEIANRTPWTRSGRREEALRRTFCSTHTVLRARAGRFVSLTDPPERLRAEAAACRNEGAWPVLVGEPGSRDVLLSSPIILEDHPRIAPESPGDLFDGGEIDQLLMLNILSLTDAEKAEMRDSDPRAREILERTEALTPEELMRLHGSIRDLEEVRR